jgi:uncharacterized membrane protein
MIKPRYTLVSFLLFLVASASAFMSVAPKATFVRPTAAPMTVAASSTTSLAAVQVDPAIADMVAKSSPIGAIALFVIIVSLWELNTPGRAKK